jgi:hypothetical protein
MTTNSSTLPIEQIEIVSLQDLFSYEELFEALSIKMFDCYPGDMERVRDERIWSCAGFVRFLDYWIESNFYDLVDPSFVYIENLWQSAYRIKKPIKAFDSDFYKRADTEDRHYKTIEYRAICKAKELLLKRPGCYVYNEVVFNEEKNPSLFSNVSIVFYDKIIDKRHWEGLFCDYVDDKYNLLLTSEQVIWIIEENFERLDEDGYEYSGKEDWAVALREAAEVLRRNPSVSVIVKDYYPFGGNYDFT